MGSILMRKYSSIKAMASIAAHLKNKMTNFKMYDMLMKGEVNNVRLLNEDALNFIQLILNKGQLKHFKIIINIEQGKTSFEKI